MIFEAKTKTTTTTDSIRLSRHELTVYHVMSYKLSHWQCLMSLLSYSGVCLMKNIRYIIGYRASVIHIHSVINIVLDSSVKRRCFFFHFEIVNWIVLRVLKYTHFWKSALSFHISGNLKIYSTIFFYFFYVCLWKLKRKPFSHHVLMCYICASYLLQKQHFHRPFLILHSKGAFFFVYACCFFSHCILTGKRIIPFIYFKLWKVVHLLIKRENFIQRKNLF